MQLKFIKESQLYSSSLLKEILIDIMTNISITGGDSILVVSNTISALTANPNEISLDATVNIKINYF